jgi:hypothetical protein
MIERVNMAVNVPDLKAKAEAAKQKAASGVTITPAEIEAILTAILELIAIFNPTPTPTPAS